MAKKKITAAQYDAAEAAYTAVVSNKLKRMGATKAAGRFNANGALRKRQSRKHFEQYVAEGGDPGDIQSFFEWLIAHSDEIIAFISKLIALFSV